MVMKYFPHNYIRTQNHQLSNQELHSHMEDFLYTFLQYILLLHLTYHRL